MEVTSPHSVRFCHLRSGHNDTCLMVLLGQLNEVVCTFLSLALLPVSGQFYIPHVPEMQSLLCIILPIIVSHGNHGRPSHRCPYFRQKEDFQNSYRLSSPWTPSLIPVCCRVISKLRSRTPKTLTWPCAPPCPTSSPTSFSTLRFQFSGVVRGWCGLGEENKSYVSGSRTENPKGSCNSVAT